MLITGKHIVRDGLMYSVLMLMSVSALADQYTSKAREVPASAATPASAERQLENAENNPYAKALLLQHLANKSLYEKDYKKAASQLEEALAQESLSEYAAETMRYQLAQLHMAGEQYQKVIDVLAPRITAYEKDAKSAVVKPGSESYLALGAAYAGLKDYKNAAPYIKKAIASEKNPPREWKQLLLALYTNAGDYKNAAGELEAMVRDDPKDKVAWMQLSTLYLKAKQKDKALSTLRLAHRLGMLKSEKELLHLAKLFMNAGVPFTAGSLLEEWLDKGLLDRKTIHLELLAAAWTAAQEQDKAIKVLRELHGKQGKPELLTQIGQLQIDKQDWDAAAQTLSQALSAGKLEYGTGETWLALGMARFEQGKKSEALQSFAKAARYSKARKLAQQWIAFIDPDALKKTKAAPVIQEKDGPDKNLASLDPNALDITPDYTDRASSQSAATDGSGFTPVGAIRAGNPLGTIPPWTGGLTPNQAPAGYKAGGPLIDPYPNDQPILVIDASNWQQHAGKLSAGHKKLLANQPGYKMKVYKSRRSASFPQAIYDATQANETRASVPHPDALRGARLGFPFPKPSTGVEIMWNHRVRYRSNDILARSHDAVVESDGAQLVNERTEEVLFRYGNIDDPADLSKENIILYYLTYGGRPGRLINAAALVHETADIEKGERRIWVGIGAGKLLRIPPVGYDNPRPGSRGLMYLDQIDMYNGAFDRYVWKLQGRKEIYVPYNDYRLMDKNLKYDQMLMQGMLNPDLPRYELHRVWVIEAEERGGKTHKFGKRVYYVDEDTWSILLVDNYDKQDQMKNFQEGHIVQYYDLQLSYTAPVMLYDVQDGRYFASRLSNQMPPIWYNRGEYKSRDYKPAAIRRRLK